MNNFVIDTPDNFWQIRWLDKYMEGHKGFIAGGCFKNILSGSGTYYERECDALFDIDGRGNTERLVTRNPKLRNLLEDDEYIPSLGQLNLMAHYMDELNKAFTYVSASPLSSTWYWSSTESSQAVAWYVVFSSGLTGTGNKHIGDMVRAVIDF